MWVARNRNGDLRLFEMPPKRFHEGPMLSAELTGFNDAVTVGDDEYSFWAVQKYFESDVIDDAKQWGVSFYTEEIEDGNKRVWCSYVPDCVKDLKWEDEPVEVFITLDK